MQKSRLSGSHVALFVLLAIGLMLAMNQQDGAGQIEDRITPDVQVIKWGGLGMGEGRGIGRFETSTGAVWKYNGDTRNVSGHGEWVPDVKGVDVRPSGTFRIQQADVATFLVDATDGRTWILRERAGNFRWELVPLVD